MELEETLKETENGISMYELGLYYHNIKDYDNMKKYYLMAIENNNDSAMFKLGRYYDDIEDYVNMLKYYNMVILHGSSDFKSRAMNNMGLYYKNIMKDYDSMEKIFSYGNRTWK